MEIWLDMAAVVWRLNMAALVGNNQVQTSLLKTSKVNSLIEAQMGHNEEENILKHLKYEKKCQSNWGKYASIL